LAKKKKARPSARTKLLGKRAANYQYKLKVLCTILGGFDARKFETAQKSQPKTIKGRQARRAALQKVARTFARVRPFVHRGYKLVRPASKRNFDTLRRHVGITKFKKLRAIPLPTIAKKVSVRFDKHGYPIIREDGVGQKVFLFPHVPRSRYVKGTYGAGQFVDAEKDALHMLSQMLPRMPDGYYMFMSRHQFLIPFSADRDKLAEEVRRLYFKYEGSPEFLGTFYGFKWLTDSEEQFAEMKKEMRSERERRKGRRRRLLAARALKEIIAMDRQLKSGQPLTRGQTTRREKLKTMGEAPWQTEKREASERAKRRGKLSKRARATGRR